MNSGLLDRRIWNDWKRTLLLEEREALADLLLAGGQYSGVLLVVRRVRDQVGLATLARRRVAEQNFGRRERISQPDSRLELETNARLPCFSFILGLLRTCS